MKKPLASVPSKIREKLCLDPKKVRAIEIIVESRNGKKKLLRYSGTFVSKSCWSAAIGTINLLSNVEVW